MIADLKNSVEREKAQLGIFVTLTPPTKPMQTEAVSAGFYESPHSGAFDKIQILTIADLLNGRVAALSRFVARQHEFQKIASRASAGRAR